MCYHVKRLSVSCVCALCRVDVLMFDVCLETFCVGILSVVGICLPLVVRGNVLLVYPGSICSCAFIFGRMPFIIFLFVLVCT